MFVVHAQSTPTPLGVRFAVAVLAGLAAAAVTSAPLNLLSHGDVPPRVAAAALWGDPVEVVPPSAAAAVHYAAGMVAGAAFELVVLGGERLATTQVVFADVVTLAEVVAAALVALVVYAAAAHGLLPRYGGPLYDGDDRGTVRRQWAVSAAVYGVALLALVPAMYVVLPVD